jgi:hypothetical protein
MGTNCVERLLADNVDDRLPDKILWVASEHFGRGTAGKTVFQVARASSDHERRLIDQALPFSAEKDRLTRAVAGLMRRVRSWRPFAFRFGLRHFATA